MNIQQFWPADGDVPPFNLDEVQRLLYRRRDTWTGFALIEQQKGIVAPSISLSSARGQDVFRLLMFRVIEELAESIDSEEEAHHKEELIDALNYLLSIGLIDSEMINEAALLQHFYSTLMTAFNCRTHEPFHASGLGEVSFMMGARIADTLRNRSWMNNAQDVYFSGQQTFWTFYPKVMFFIVKPFRNWSEFYKYFVAKDDVLQFRLRSNY